MRRSDFGTDHGSPLDIMDRSAIATPSLAFDPVIDRVATLAFSVPFPIAWAIPAQRDIPMLLPELRRRQRRKHGPPGVRQPHASMKRRSPEARLPYMTGTFAYPGPVSGDGPDRSGLRSVCSSVRFVSSSDSANKNATKRSRLSLVG